MAQQPTAGPSSAKTFGGVGRTAVLNGGRAPKRRKTQRACDYCRDHKLRCDFDNASEGVDGGKVCKHCADFGIECIVSAPTGIRPRPTISTSASAIGSTNRSFTASSSFDHRAPQSWVQPDDRPLDDPRYGGESSLSALVSHFITLVATRREQTARKVDHTHEVDETQPTGSDNFLLLPQIRYPAPLEGNEGDLVNAHIGLDTIRLLMDRYLTYIQPLNSIVSHNEVLEALDLSNPSQPIASLSHLALAILCLAAMYRSTPRSVRDALLFHQRQRRMSIFRSSVETVQSLLVLSQSIEMMAPDTNDAAGMSLNMLGLAIRMAQDLGMHRNLSRLGVDATKSRRFARIWSGLVMQDRWYSLCYGQPHLIHLDDCDVAPPSPFADEQDPDRATSSTPQPFLTHIAHYDMSLLMGRLHKLAFGPRGLSPNSHVEVRQIKREMDAWDARLPSSICFATQAVSIDCPSISAGWLFSMRNTLDYLAYRIALNLHDESLPFDRSDDWTRLVRNSSEALEWLSSADGLHCLDSYSITLYFLVQCSVIQYYNACQGGSLHSLRVARQSLQNQGSVATAATSRSQIYDPYGPDEQQRQSYKVGDSISSGIEPVQASSAVRATMQSGGGGRDASEGESVSPSSSKGTPKLLRLRVKISALITLLLEMAEQRRAMVLARNDSSTDTASSMPPSSLSSIKHQYPATGIMQDIKLTLPPSMKVANHASSGGLDTASNAHRYRGGGRLNASHAGPHTYACHFDNTAISTPPLLTSQYGTSSSDADSFRYQNGLGNGGDAATTYNRNAVPYDAGVQNVATAVQPIDNHTSTSHGSANGHAQPVHHSANVVLAGSAFDATGHAAPSAAAGTQHIPLGNASPRRIEDLDLIQLQHWADALLRNPTAVVPAAADVQHSNPPSSFRTYTT